MDGYFIERLKKLRSQLDFERIKTLEKAKNTLDDLIVDDVTIYAGEERAIDRAINMCNSETVITGEQEITAALEVLSDINEYHAETRIKVKDKNINYNLLTQIFEEYKDMSIMVKTDGKVFNARNIKNWKEAEINEGEIIHFYAKCHYNNKERALEVIRDRIDSTLNNYENDNEDIGYEEQSNEEIVQGPDETKKDMLFIKKKIKINDEYGLHGRPISTIVKASTNYDGEVYIRNPQTNKYCRAKSLLEILSEVAMGTNPTKNEKGELEYKDIELFFEYDPKCDFDLNSTMEMILKDQQTFSLYK
jgi:phosphotransferase system HPr-like phosphotransfer protein